MSRLISVFVISNCVISNFVFSNFVTACFEPCTFELTYLPGFKSVERTKDDGFFCDKNKILFFKFIFFRKISLSPSRSHIVLDINIFFKKSKISPKKIEPVNFFCQNNLYFELVINRKNYSETRLLRTNYYFSTQINPVITNAGSNK